MVLEMTLKLRLREAVVHKSLRVSRASFISGIDNALAHWNETKHGRINTADSLKETSSEIQTDSTKNCYHASHLIPLI